MVSVDKSCVALVDTVPLHWRTTSSPLLCRAAHVLPKDKLYSSAVSRRRDFIEEIANVILCLSNQTVVQKIKEVGREDERYIG